MSLALSVVLLGAAVLALLAGAVLGVRGLHQRHEAAGFGERSEPATAEVVASLPKDVALAGEPATIYYQQVRFRVGDRDVEAQTMTGVEPPVPHVGERVEVRYDPRHPTRVVLAGADPTAGAGATSLALARMMLGLGMSLPVAWVVILGIARTL
ncbi:hypothetical protein I601_0236 [Nocardioides dokdonensis FR1436]|uniref:DUF3592 domain-containing protein n=1 Tax=Nocardioides dokdonensis FR1436 TaxID=1300347 RepID=A0A1A9GED6_9ACTN|nr:DUF3592 domain-containing protein [Nocardioides dokdonensis]ANH36689.1 hypothetical protein I601_0236 [Nocardioides dokdonensis FR1436]